MTDDLALFELASPRVYDPPAKRAAPRARRTDPDTSRIAAESVRLSEQSRRRLVLAAFVEHGPMIVAEVQDRVAGRPNTIAGAVSRYEHAGWLGLTGVRRQSPWGSWMDEHDITYAGRMLLEGRQ